MASRSNPRWLVCVASLAAATASAQTVFDVQFSEGSDGFVYGDDAFLSSHAPEYAEGSWVAEAHGAKGVLSISLGGRDSLPVTGMSGGWSKEFALDRAMRDLRILFRCQLVQASGFERDEFGQVMVAFDGLLLTDSDLDYLARIEGDGDGGTERATGWVVLSTTVATAGKGRHVLTIGGLSNKKTAEDETTQILIDDVRVTGTPGPGR